MKPDTYRPDIDGLRAVAVGAVILYHLSSRLAPGGYVGVDIFFVISGFLITGIIKREIEAGTFSFRQFYARRIRRIVPALLLVIVATLAAGYVLLLPRDLADLARSTRWATFGASNFYFWSETGYFAPAAEGMPLLHTWSLGVEEQFYLVWPLLLVLATPLLRRLRVPGLWLVALIVAVSLAYAISLASDVPDELFYSPFARAWELGLGAALAYAPALARRPVGVGLDIGGLLGIAVAVWLPALPALINVALACISAAALLYPRAAPTLVGHGLALPPVVFLGKISYSLYLWHWPILVLYRHYYAFEAFSLRAQLAYLGVTLVAAILSWRLVEVPFRSWRAPPVRTLAVGGMALVIVFLVASPAVTGLRWRFDENDLRYLSAAGAPTGNPPGSRCFIDSRRERQGDGFTPDLCLSIVGDKPNVLVIGDSHANQFVGGLRAVYPEINFSQASASGCFLLKNDTGQQRCLSVADATYETYLEQYRFDAVIISARWRNGPHMKRVKPSVNAIVTSGARAYVLGPTSEFKIDAPEMLTYELIRDVSLGTRLQVLQPQLQAERALEAALVDTNAEFWRTTDILCPQERCMTLTPSSDAMLHDDNHLSEQGALWLLTELKQQGFLSALFQPAGAEATAQAQPAGPVEITLRGAARPH